ncbi:hypothetical protein [Virgisporangium aurantiacum]|uniref:hypothetical protein n=1 Tax=Virgisporangium aurantiacum TaxID=175570 RepID=UPI00194F3124|nr:hypothetical protein [Virgisporangium aurantiacum]
MFVTDRRVAYTAFPAEFLRQRIAALGRDGGFRVTSLQLQRDLLRKRPYPLERPPRLWDDDFDFAHPPAPPVVVAVGATALGYWWAVAVWRDALPVELIIGGVVALVLFCVPVFTFLGFLVYLLFRVVPLFVLRLSRRLARAVVPDRRKVVLTRSALTAVAHTVTTDLVDEHGTAPPPAPDPVRFAVLCPDPAVAACLWANEVGDRLGGLVVTTRDEVPRAAPVLDLSDRTPDDSPADLLAAVLRFGCRHLDAGRTGFLTWPVGG